MEIDLVPKPAGERRIYLVFGVLIVSAWVALIAWQGSPYAELLGHEALADHHISFVGHLSTFLLSWLLMTVAMMLPASLPLLAQTQRNRAGDTWFFLVMLAGYLSTWVLFGLLAFLGDNALHEMTEPGAPLATASDFIAPAILLAAGVYQLTPFKRSFTERCKTSSNTGLSKRDLHESSTLKLGFQSGLNCVGSCWSLMLVMFALGHHRLDWMLMIGAITAVERLTPWGTRLEQVVGALLIAWCVLSLITIS